MQRSNPVKWTRACWWLLLIAALLLGEAAAQGVGTGTEVFVTDALGQRLVGYGVVQGNGLQLQLDNVGETMVVMLVSPGGSVTTLQAVRAGDGSLLVAMPDGSYESLSTYFGTVDVALTVVGGNGGNGLLHRPSLPPQTAAAQTSPAANGASEDGGGDKSSTSKSNNGKNDN